MSGEKKKLFYIKIPTRTVDQSHNGTEEQSNSGAVEQQNCGTVAQRNSGKKAHRNTVLLHLVTQLHYPISTPLPCFLYCRLQNEVYTLVEPSVLAREHHNLDVLVELKFLALPEK